MEIITLPTYSKGDNQLNKKKLFSIVSTGVLTASLFAPMASSTVEAASPYENFNTAKYGDRVDIDQYLNELSENESYIKQAEEQMKIQAGQLADENEGDENADSEASPFTYDGGTKFFLDRNLAFKDFTLRSVGDNVEIWVANDLAYGPDNPKPAEDVRK